MSFPGAESAHSDDPLRPINGASFPWRSERPGGGPEDRDESRPPTPAQPAEPPAPPVMPVWPSEPSTSDPFVSGPVVEVAAEGGAARRQARPVITLLAVVAIVAALGAPLGWLWVQVAPTVPVRMTDDGPVLVEPQPEEFIAADGWFALLGLAFGVLAAVVVWIMLRRLRGPAALLAVTAGAIAAGAIAWWLGRQIGLSEFERLLREAATGTTFGKPADLRAAKAVLLFGAIPLVWGNVLVPGFGAAIAYTLLAGWSRFPSLQPEPELPRYWHDPNHYDAERDDDPHAWGSTPISWDSTAPPAPPAAPAPPAPGEAAPPRD